MCSFCESVRDKYFDSLEIPYWLVFDPTRGNDDEKYYIAVPTDDGVEYSVDEIKYCPYCGREL